MAEGPIAVVARAHYESVFSDPEDVPWDQIGHTNQRRHFRWAEEYLAVAERLPSSSPSTATCTCGMTPEHPDNQGRAGAREGSGPESWCRARLLNWVQTEGLNLMHPPVGWSVFGSHVEDVPDGGLEFWGDDGAGLPMWERPAQGADRG